MKAIRLERDYPLLAALALLLSKVLVYAAFGDFSPALFPSDVAFSGLSFDLWAFVSLVVYNAPLGEESLTNGEKILVYAISGGHFLLFVIVAALESDLRGGAAHQFIAQNLLLTGLLVGTLTYWPAFRFLHRKFREV